MKKILSFLKDKFKNKIQIIIIILVIVLFPIIIRILEYVFDFDIDANGWVGFLGSYIGSIIGAITALMVVNIEIKNSRKEKKNDEIKQLRPYLWLFVESIENNNVCGKIKNIGLNTAIFYSIETNNSPIDKQTVLYCNSALCKNDELQINRDFNLDKTEFFNFIFYDMIGNRYTQELRISKEDKTALSLDPIFDEYHDKMFN
ncbi:MAG TPA: hypothetical protein OIM30_09715 [Oscillospiraceae bacterium]|nr:hypothetical protein [Oscillospiraceae bacterium]